MENAPFGMGTPLHAAIDHGNTKVVAYLLKCGADDSVRDTLGRTALELAQSKGFDHVIKLLQR